MKNWHKIMGSVTACMFLTLGFAQAPSQHSKVTSRQLAAALTTALGKTICVDDKLKKSGLSQARCQKVVGDYTAQCLGLYLPGFLVNQRSDKYVATWSASIGKCVGTVFHFSNVFGAKVKKQVPPENMKPALEKGLSKVSCEFKTWQKKDGSNLLKSSGITHKRCLDLIKPIIDKCYYLYAPAFSVQGASEEYLRTWGYLVGYCSANVFKVNYLEGALIKKQIGH